MEESGVEGGAPRLIAESERAYQQRCDIAHASGMSGLTPFRRVKPEREGGDQFRQRRDETGVGLQPLLPGNA